MLDSQCPIRPHAEDDETWSPRQRDTLSALHREDQASASNRARSRHFGGLPSRLCTSSSSTTGLSIFGMTMIPNGVTRTPPPFGPLVWLGLVVESNQELIGAFLNGLESHAIAVPAGPLEHG